MHEIKDKQNEKHVETQAYLFPQTDTRYNLQLSKLTLLTKLMCTPSRRWLPEHSRHMKAPMGRAPGGLPGGGTMREAHRGCRSGQSEQTMFSGLAISALRRFLSCCWDAIVCFCDCLLAGILLRSDEMQWTRTCSLPGPMQCWFVPSQKC